MSRPRRAQVALVEIAVDERVGKPARVDGIPSVAEPVQQPAELDLDPLRQPAPPPGDEVGERGHEGVAPPIGEAQLQQVVHAPDHALCRSTRRSTIDRSTSPLTK